MLMLMLVYLSSFVAYAGLCEFMWMYTISGMIMMIWWWVKTGVPLLMDVYSFE